MILRLRRFLAFLLLPLAGVLLTWGLWPAGTNEQTLAISPENIRLVQADSPLLLRLKTPHFARAGDTLAVQLQCIPPGVRHTATPPTVLARARLEMGNLEVHPATAVSQPLLGESVVFYWHLSSREAGAYRGRLWFHLETVTAGEDATNGEQALAALPLQIETRTFLGLTGAAARTSGILAALTSALLFLLSRQRVFSAPRLEVTRPSGAIGDIRTSEPGRSSCSEPSDG